MNNNRFDEDENDELHDRHRGVENHVVGGAPSHVRDDRFDDAGKGMIPRNLLVWVVLVVALVVAVGLVLQSFMGIDNKAKRQAVENARTADEMESNDPNAILLQQRIREQERAAAEAEAQRKIDEANAKAAALKAEMEKREAMRNTPPPPSPEGNGSGEKSQAELEREKLEKMREAAAASGIIAIGGRGAMGGGSEPQTDPTVNAMQQMQSQMVGALGQMANNGNLGAEQRNEDWLKNQEKMARASTVFFGNSERDGRVLHQGTSIPGVLITRINSDLPGQLTAQVTSNVYDSINGTHLIIPKGSKLIGRYSSGVSQGQERVLVAFERIIKPDGSSAFIGGMQGADQAGASGMHDEVDTHFWEMLGSSLLIATLAGLADGLSNDNNSNVTVVSGGSSTLQTTSSSAGQVLVDTAEKSLERYTNRKPTLIINPGYRFNIMVNKDIRL